MLFIIIFFKGIKTDKYTRFFRIIKKKKIRNMGGGVGGGVKGVIGELRDKCVGSDCIVLCFATVRHSPLFEHPSPRGEGAVRYTISFNIQIDYLYTAESLPSTRGVPLCGGVCCIGKRKLRKLKGVKG